MKYNAKPGKNLWRMNRKYLIPGHKRHVRDKQEAITEELWKYEADMLWLTKAKVGAGKAVKGTLIKPVDTNKFIAAETIPGAGPLILELGWLVSSLYILNLYIFILCKYL